MHYCRVRPRRPCTLISTAGKHRSTGVFGIGPTGPLARPTAVQIALLPRPPAFRAHCPCMPCHSAPLLTAANQRAGIAQHQDSSTSSCALLPQPPRQHYWHCASSRLYRPVINYKPARQQYRLTLCESTSVCPSVCLFVLWLSLVQSVLSSNLLTVKVSHTEKNIRLNVRQWRRSMLKMFPDTRWNFSALHWSKKMKAVSAPATTHTLPTQLHQQA